MGSFVIMEGDARTRHAYQFQISRVFKLRECAENWQGCMISAGTISTMGEVCAFVASVGSVP